MEETKIKREPDFIQGIARRLSIAVFLKFFEKSELSANQITVANFLVNNLAAVYFFSRGTYIGNLLGLVFCILSAAVDYIDGTIARIRKTDSSLGEWLDSSLDFIWQILLICAVTYGAFLSQGKRPVWVIVGFLAVAGLAVSNYISGEYRHRFNLDFYKDAAGIKKACAAGRLNAIEYIYAGIIAPGTFLFIFLFTIRYFIALGAVLNIMHLVLITIMVFSVIRSLVLFYVFVLHFKFSEGKDVKHKELIQLLNNYMKGNLRYEKD